MITPLPQQELPKCTALFDFVIDDENEKDCLTFQKVSSKLLQTCLLYEWFYLALCKFDQIDIKFFSCKMEELVAACLPGIIHNTIGFFLWS